MIKTIKLANFFSFKDETITLDPDINIMVGINGSGKSNFLRALELLNKGLVGGDDSLKNLIIRQWGGVDEIFFAGEKNDGHIEITYEIDKDKLSKFGGFRFEQNIFYTISIYKKSSSSNYTLSERLSTQKEGGYEYFYTNGGLAWVTERTKQSGIKKLKYEYDDSQELFLKDARFNDNEKFYPIYSIRKALSDFIIYNQFDTTRTGPIRKPDLAIESKRLATDASNLTQLLHTYFNNKTNIYNNIVASLSVVNPYFKSIGFSMLGSIELTLQEAHLNKTIHISKISDGTLRYLCLMSILLNPERGNSIGIDEPELGLHPDMINHISEAIESSGNQSQMIISTHEYRILNHFKLNQIMVFEKDEQNSTKVLRYDEENFKDWYEKYMPGNMWRDGDLGGKRW